MPTRSADDWPNRVRELRKARKLTIEQLARKVGCSVTFMSDLERGERDLGHAWMVRITHALKVRVADLLNDHEQNAPISGHERKLIDQYRQASDEQQSQISAMFDVILSKGK